MLHEGSPRHVAVDALEVIVRGLAGVKVGVFVERKLDEVAAIARRCGLHGLQLARRL